jgi:hypothetical protein
MILFALLLWYLATKVEYLGNAKANADTQNVSCPFAGLILHCRFSVLNRVAVCPSLFSILSCPAQIAELWVRFLVQGLRLDALVAEERPLWEKTTPPGH